MRMTQEEFDAIQQRRHLAPAKQRLASAKQHPPGGKAAELALRDSILEAGIPPPYREFTFHPTRDWRLDLAWPQFKLAIEIDGSVHRTKQRFASDIEKHNALMLAGWRYFRVTPADVKEGRAFLLVAEIFVGVA